MKVLFIHENTLGHGSYLPPFVDFFLKHPEFGIEPEILNATPLPQELAREADRTIRGLRRFGLDNHFVRWRNIVSAHVRAQVAGRLGACDAVVVNTQSVGLDLADIGKPLYVALDATFRQQSQSRWFSDPPLGRLAPKLIAGLIEKEARLFESAARLLPWSEQAARSVASDYGIEAEKIVVLPPSIEIPAARQPPNNPVPRALFIGGDFKRKGGDVLLKAFKHSFQNRMELDLVTESDVQPGPGIRVWKGVRAYSPKWRSVWEAADVFIFPSCLETFGIVLVEALAFGVPVISSRAGAATEILADGQAGLFIRAVTIHDLTAAIEEVLANPAPARERAAFGRKRAETAYALSVNGARVASLLNAPRG